MNHWRNFVRLVIIVFWLVLLGVISSILNNAGNMLALSWISLLIPLVALIVVIYIGVFFTYHCWNIK
jgi:hypothetical protein